MSKKDINTINIIIELRKAILNLENCPHRKRIDYESSLEFYEDLDLDFWEEEEIPRELTIEEKIEYKHLVSELEKADTNLRNYLGKEEYYNLIRVEQTFNWIEPKTNIKKTEVPADWEIDNLLTLLPHEERLNNLGSTYVVIDRDVNKSTIKDKMFLKDLIEVNGEKYKVKKDITTFIEYVLDEIGYNTDFEFDIVKDYLQDVEQHLSALIADKTKTIRDIFHSTRYKKLKKEVFKDMGNGVFKCLIKHSVY